MLLNVVWMGCKTSGKSSHPHMHEAATDHRDSITDKARDDDRKKERKDKER